MVTAVFLAAALSPLGSTMIAVALPSIGGELGIDNQTLTQWLVASYLIVGIACMSPGGTLGDRIGHRTTLVLGMLVYGAGSLAGFILASLPSLAFARVCMALGGALTVPAAMALLRKRVETPRRMRVFGYFAAAMGAAAAIGPLVGGELTSLFGWRAVFVANIPVIALALALLRRRRAPSSASSGDDRARAARFDVVGSLLLGGGLTLAIVPAAITPASTLGVRAAGVALLIVFFVWGRHVRDPVLDLALFRSRPFAAASAIIGLQNLAMYALLFQLPLFFEQVRDVPAGTSGRVVVAMMLAMVAFSPLGGRVAERIGPRLTVIAGSSLTLYGVYLVGDPEALQHPVDALAGLVLLGAGLGLSSAPCQASAMGAADVGRAGMAAGAISTMRYIGGVVGIAVLGGALGRAGETAATTPHSAATSVYALSLALAAALALLLPRHWPRERAS